MLGCLVSSPLSADVRILQISSTDSRGWGPHACSVAVHDAQRRREDSSVRSATTQYATGSSGRAEVTVLPPLSVCLSVCQSVSQSVCQSAAQQCRSRPAREYRPRPLCPELSEQRRPRAPGLKMAMPGPELEAGLQNRCRHNRTSNPPALFGEGIHIPASFVGPWRFVETARIAAIDFMHRMGR